MEILFEVLAVGFADKAYSFDHRGETMSSRGEERGEN